MVEAPSERSITDRFLAEAMRYSPKYFFNHANGTKQSKVMKFYFNKMTYRWRDKKQAIANYFQNHKQNMEDVIFICWAHFVS